MDDRMTYREIYEFGVRELEKRGFPEAKIDARLLLENVCNTGYSSLFTDGDRALTKEETDLYEAYLTRRFTHEPVQQITGECEFMGLTFMVTRDVLTPRQDTENLVEEVLKELHDGMEILDMCTGSGCILCSLLHYSNDCKGTGVDISLAALDVARQNAARLSVESEFIHSDLFENVQGKYDRIISNPPYIASDVIESLMDEVKMFEPMLALDGKEDGLYFYQRIVEDAKKHLYRNGMLYFEIGYDQGKAVSELMINAGYKEVTVVKDFAGNDRIVYGCYYE